MAERDRRPAALVTNGLSKRYGSRLAVDALSIEVPTGVVAGFVGPNGAGKTTTMAMLLGLVRPTAGTATVLGSSIEAPASYLHRVGALIEAPSFWPGLTGVQNHGPGRPRRARREPDPGRARARRPRRARLGPVRRLLIRDEAAPRHRSCPSRGSRAARSGRADQWPRSGRDQRDARLHSVGRRRPAHRARLVAHPERARASVRLADRHRPGLARLSGPDAGFLSRAGTVVALAPSFATSIVSPSSHGPTAMSRETS